MKKDKECFVINVYYTDTLMERQQPRDQWHETAIHAYRTSYKWYWVNGRAKIKNADRWASLDTNYLQGFELGTLFKRMLSEECCFVGMRMVYTMYDNFKKEIYH